MVNQAKISLCICSPFWLRVNSEFREGELSSLPPQLDGGLNLWGPKKIGLLGGLRRFGHHGSGAVHVIAPNLVFGAIAAINVSVLKQARQPHKPTIVGKSHHTGCVSSCKSCSPFGTWCDCASRGLRLVQPLEDVLVEDRERV